MNRPAARTSVQRAGAKYTRKIRELAAGIDTSKMPRLSEAEFTSLKQQADTVAPVV